MTLPRYIKFFVLAWYIALAPAGPTAAQETTPAVPEPIPGADAKGCCSIAGSRSAFLLTAASSASSAVAEGAEGTVETNPAPGGIAGSEVPAGPRPEGMVWVPGGVFTMGGVGDEARRDEFPVHKVRVDGFWMDETEVTNGQFRKFVEATGFVTTAEKPPVWEELAKTLPPGTPKPDDSVLVAGSMLFKPTAGPVPLENPGLWWMWMPGADWRHPLGPRSSLGPEQDNFPVVHVSWDDAVAYCKWAGKRLPTEAEWERACRGGVEGQRFIWGDDAPSDTNIKANLWQGGFPYEKKPNDGYLLGAPVKSFPPNGYGLYDMIGNVWEWTADWYRADTYQMAADHGPDYVEDNPPGPSESLDPDEPHMPKRVNRGGSFLCNAQYCDSYRPSARMKTSPDTGQIHLGFRGVMSQRDWEKLQAATTTPQ